MKTYIIKWVEHRTCSAKVLATNEDDAAAAVYDLDDRDFEIDISRSDVDITDCYEDI